MFIPLFFVLMNVVKCKEEKERKENGKDIRNGTGWQTP